MSEASAGFRFARNRLLADAQMVTWFGDRVWESVAPPDATYPYILGTLVAATDLIIIGGRRVWADMLWQWEVWSRTNDPAVVAQRATHMDGLLHNVSGTVTGASYWSGIVVGMVRERELRLPPEVDGDVIYRRGGGEYRQLVSAA